VRAGTPCCGRCTGDDTLAPVESIPWHDFDAHELRIPCKRTTLRFALGASQRAGSGALFFDEQGLTLPGAFLPMLRRDGSTADDIGDALATAAPGSRSVDAELLLLAGDDSRSVTIVPARWVQGATEAALHEVTRTCQTLPGIRIDEEERVFPLGASLPAPAWVQRLPRMVLQRHDEIADNTDLVLSMGSLLENFVERFSGPDHALAHVRIATGYLYRHGFARTLKLLDNPRVQTVRLLFSGRTDRATARALTGLLDVMLRAEMDNDPNAADIWHRLHEAVAAKRFDVRVYTDAFLHAKLFLAFDGIDQLKKLRNGYAVVGSSNVSAPGLRHGGNLELDVSVHDRDRTTELNRWFERRWEEASDPEPSLLEVLDSARPSPPPIFATEGLDAVWRAGRDGRLKEPAKHLRLLASLYAERIAKLSIPTAAAFPIDPDRSLHPTPEQEEGVLALVQRLEQTRLAFLADSVGLGKTITALGVAAYMRRNGLSKRVSLIAPRKLWDHWKADCARVHLPLDTLDYVNRHELERLDERQATHKLKEADLLIVEEAHESLRNRRNELWMHLRGHLRSHRDCRLLLVSATPWNTSREDIYNYLLLAWNEGSVLSDRYPALASPPLAAHLASFRVSPASSLPVSRGLRAFLQLPRERFKEVFDGAFVQRTRSRLEAQGASLDFPERRVLADNAPPSESHDHLFAVLADELPRLRVPYREPFLAFQRSATTLHGGTLEEDASNLERSFLTQLYKRAESSLFALAASLSTIRARLDDFQAVLEQLLSESRPKAALGRYLQEFFIKVQADESDDEDNIDRDVLASDQKARFTRVSALLERLDDTTTRALLTSVIADQVGADRTIIAGIQRILTFDLDEKSPKDLLLLRRAREAYALGHKPILIAGYADTAMRTFMRVVDALPDARIALVLGNGEAWLHRPDQHARKPLQEEEWVRGTTLERAARASAWIVGAQRGEPLSASDALDAFAPRSRMASNILLAELGGEIDIVIGSEAISVGHNLQDSTSLVHLDLPWNPMVIEQRIGRIDRRGGGRPDETRPLGRRIVDVYYCWSDAAIEREVQLRARLRSRATGAIEDTNFDELLLYELLDRIQKVREARARELAVSGVLGTRQQHLAEQTGRAPELSVVTGSELDGLRILAQWSDEHADTDPPEAPAACGVTDDSPSRFLVTLELEPLDGRGTLLPTMNRMLISLPVDSSSEESDLEAVVRALLAGGAHLSRPGPTLRHWTEGLVQLDQTLQRLTTKWVERHNSETQALAQARLTPHARADPSQRLRNLVVSARDAFQAAAARVPRDSPLVEKRERLKFLAQVILDPLRVADVVAEVGEKATQDLLLHLRDHADKVLRDQFDTFFEKLAGGLWQATQAGTTDAQMELPSADDGLWSSLRVRVLAATFCGPQR